MQTKNIVSVIPACPACGNDNPNLITIEGDRLGCKECGKIYKGEVK